MKFDELSFTLELVKIHIKFEATHVKFEELRFKTKF